MTQTTRKEDWVASSTPSVKLYTKTWVPEEEIIATVVFCHGLGEHVNRYDELFDYFAAHGIKTTAFDQRGFGHTVRLQGNHGVAGDKDGLETTIRDVKVISDRARIKSIPHFVMGHSMGGYLALRFASENQSSLSGCIASAPCIRVAEATYPGVVDQFFLSVLPSVLPNFSLPNKIDITQLSRDKQEVEKYRNDPLVHGFASIALARDLVLRASELISKHASRFALPLLVAHGNKDSLTCHKASKEFVSKAQSKDKTFQEYHMFYHELHNEPKDDRKQVFDMYVNWIKARV
ncbi:hypothetical protein HDV03_000394 [Kappamyces sp. JEL0829]|nr:hypothetical protein HDV03_000394 [Kappamyces sp. JEL0829]